MIAPLQRGFGSAPEHELRSARALERGVTTISLWHPRCKSLEGRGAFRSLVTQTSRKARSQRMDRMGGSIQRTGTAPIGPRREPAREGRAITGDATVADGRPARSALEPGHAADDALSLAHRVPSARENPLRADAAGSRPKTPASSSQGLSLREAQRLSKSARRDRDRGGPATDALSPFPLTSGTPLSPEIYQALIRFVERDLSIDRGARPVQFYGGGRHRIRLIKAVTEKDFEPVLATNDGYNDAFLTHDARLVHDVSRGETSSYQPEMKVLYSFDERMRRPDYDEERRDLYRTLDPEEREAVESYRARLHDSKYDPRTRETEREQISASNKFGLTDSRSGLVLFALDGVDDRLAADKGTAQAQSFTSREIRKVYREWLRNPVETREQITLVLRKSVVSMDVFFNQPHWRAYGRVLDAKEGVSRVPPRDAEEERASAGIKNALRSLLLRGGIDTRRF